MSRAGGESWRALLSILASLGAVFAMVMFLAAYLRGWDLRELVFWGVVVLLSPGQPR